MGRLRWIVVCVLATACGEGDDDDLDPGPDGGGGGGEPPLACDPLPAATAPIIEVTPDQAGELRGIIEGATAGTTVLFADGTYSLTEALRFSAGVTLRSASGDPTAVILDAGYVVAEAIQVTVPDVTVAELTVTRAMDHPIHVTAPGFRMYRVHLVDGGEQFLKGNPDGATVPDDGRVECSVFTMTDAGRPHVERTPGGCYTGGIDVHAGAGWLVRGNRFEGIYCAGEGLAEHAIHFWRAASDAVVENNVIVNCARGIGFGLGDGAADGTTGGVIRNNVVWADIEYFDTGIGLESASGVRVLHNTVLSTDAATGFYSSIDYRFGGSVVEIRNNLTRRITVRDGASGAVDHNLEDTPLDLFVDAAGGDFHLAPTASVAIDQGVAVADPGTDLDGESRPDGPPDLGADER